MKKTRMLVGVLLTFLVGGVVMAGVAGATDFRSGDNATVGKDEIVDSSLYVAGRNIDIAGEINGDVFCAGLNISISGTVRGDVLCAGQTIRISGVVDGDIRVAAQTISINADVEGNATVAGQSFTLDSDGSIGGDITLGSTDAFINGSIGRDVVVGGNKVVIANTVGRNIKGDVSSLELAAGAAVAGNINFTSKNNLTRAAEATVGGEIIRTASDVAGAPKRGAVFGFGLGWFIYWLLAMLVVALAFALLFPRILHNASEHSLRKPWKALLVGLVASLIVPVMLVVLSITFIGIPLAILLGLLWLIVVMLSGPFAGYYLGRLLVPKSRNSLLIMLVGTSVLIVTYFIPFIGILAMLAAWWIGSGMILQELLRRTPKPVYEVEHTNQTLSKKRKNKTKE